MGSIIKNWENQLKGVSLPQKVVDKVKPETPLKNKIDFAQKKLELQISKLNTITEKLKIKHNYIFKKIVNAQKSNNHPFARAYAIELHEIRKMDSMINNAKLSMEQIKIRLSTVSELGDVVVTLSPCMSIIKGLGATLTGIMPQANASLADLSNVLGNVLSNSSFSINQSSPKTNHENADTLSIIQEAQAIIEGQARKKIPEPPPILQDSNMKQTESAI